MLKIIIICNNNTNWVNKLNNNKYIKGIAIDNDGNNILVPSSTKESEILLHMYIYVSVSALSHAFSLFADLKRP